MAIDTKNPQNSNSSKVIVESQEAQGANSSAPPPVRPASDTSNQPLPLPGSAGSQPAPFDPRQAPMWQALLAEYEREIAAMGDVPAAAPLYYESGKLWEEKLAQPRNAWFAYNKAFQLQPTLLPNIRAARRLASQVGNWNAAIHIIDSEIQACSDPIQKAYLFHRRGLIMEEKLGRAEEARASYESAMSLDPQNVELLKQLERLNIATGDWKAVLDIRLRLLEVIRDSQVQVQLLLSSARIHEIHFKDLAQAEALYRRTLQIDAGNLAALSSLRRMYSESKRYEQMVDLLPQEANGVADPTQASMLYYQLARILREQLGDDERAIDALKKALEFSPSDHMLLGELSSIYEHLMRWQELVEVIERQVLVITDRQELVSLFFKLGNIWEEKLFNEDQAIPNYRKVLGINPNYLPALQALGKLFYRKGQWEALVQMYEIEIRENTDPKAKSVKLYKLAEILEERLGRDEDTMQKLEQCLDLSPGYLPALKALGRLYSKYNRWESLISMYEKEILVTSDQDQQIFLLDKIGSLWEEKLNNIDKAVETAQRILEISPNYLPAIRTLGKLYVRADRWEDTIRINELEAQLVNDQKQVISLLHRNGEVYEEKLNNKDMSIETYKKVLALAPNYLPALQSLGRLYFITGRWEDLVAMYRQEIEVTQSEQQQITLLYNIGKLYEEKLVQEDQAIASYQEVLRIQANYFPALNALIRIFTNRGDWENLLEVQERSASALEDSQQKALSLFRVTEIWENHLSRPDKAVDTLQRILQIVPNHAPAIGSLIRLYSEGGNWLELLAVHERQLQNTSLDSQKVEMYSQMAEIYTARLNDLVRATECYEKILSLKPDHLPSLEALERIYLTQRNYGTLIRIYEFLVSRTQDPKLQVSFQAQIADIKENRLQPPQNAGENHLKVVALDPFHPDAIRSLDILYHRFGTWNGLRLLYERELARARTVDEQIDLCMRVADLAETRLQALPLAIHYYQEVLRLDPDFLPAIKALKRIYLGQENLQEMIALLGREGQISRDPRQAITTLLQAGQIYRDRFKDSVKAVECFFKVLERDPKETNAFSQLESLLLQIGDWEKIAFLYTNRITVTEDSRGLIELNLKLGAVLAERLQRPKDASSAYQQILRINPSHVQAVAALAGLSFGLEEWDKAIQLTNRLLELGCEPRLQQWAHSQLGILYQEKKPDLERAILHFHKVLESTPGDLAALQRLKSIYFARQQWPEVVEILGRLMQADSNPGNRIAHALEQAAVFETGLNDPDRAAAAYRQVQQLDSNNVQVVQKLGELYERLERWPELAEVYHAFVRLMPQDRLAETIPLLLKLGAIYAHKLNNLDKAIIAYRQAAEINPRSPDVHLALASLYGRSNMYYANAIEEHRRLLEISPLRLDSYHEMRRIFEEQRAYDKVFCVCSVLHFLRAADQNEEFFFGENQSKVPERSQEQLSDDDIDRLLLHPLDKGLVHDLMVVLGSQLAKVFPPDLERHGVGKGNRARPDDPLRGMCQSILGNLTPAEYDLYISSQPLPKVLIENSEPPALIVSDGLIKRTNVLEQRFALGRSLQRIRSGSFIARQLGAKDLARLMAAVVFPFHPSCTWVSTAGGSGAVEDLSKQVAKALSRKARKSIEELLQKQMPALNRAPSCDDYILAAEHSANRVGLIMSNDVAQAIMHLLREIPEMNNQPQSNSSGELMNILSRFPHLGELIRFSVSEEYFRLRARLKFSIIG